MQLILSAHIGANDDYFCRQKLSRYIYLDAEPENHEDVNAFHILSMHDSEDMCRLAGLQTYARMRKLYQHLNLTRGDAKL